MEYRMSYRGHTCGWFRDCGCLFFCYDIENKLGDYLQYDRRALVGLKKRFKDNIDKLEGPKIKGQKYSTTQWTC